MFLAVAEPTLRYRHPNARMCSAQSMQKDPLDQGSKCVACKNKVTYKILITHKLQIKQTRSSKLVARSYFENE